MPKWGYSITEEELDPEKTVKASGREVKISPKHAREICKTIKGMMLARAKEYLRDVSAKRNLFHLRGTRRNWGTITGCGNPSWANIQSKPQNRS